MNYKVLALEDQPIFRAAEAAAPQMIGDTCFTNLFIWRSYYHTHWAEAHGCLCLLARPEGEMPFALPPVGAGDRVAAVRSTFEALAEFTEQPVMRRVPEDLVDELAARGEPYHSTHDRDNDDYVYLREKICTLSGRRMHQKKNHYNYFINHNQFQCLPITSELSPKLLTVQESWLATKEERNESSRQLKYEVESVHQLLKSMDSLNQIGLAILINGRIEGFTMGEVLSLDTALVHVEKANLEIRGLFVALASHFCRLLPPELIYINREQDLGLPGLRFSKESFKPDHLRRKFTLTSRGLRTYLFKEEK